MIDVVKNELALERPLDSTLSGNLASRAVRLYLKLEDLSRFAADSIPDGTILRLSQSWGGKTLFEPSPYGGKSEVHSELFLAATAHGIQVFRHTSLCLWRTPELLLGPPTLLQCLRAARSTSEEDITNKIFELGQQNVGRRKEDYALKKDELVNNQMTGTCWSFSDS